MKNLPPMLIPQTPRFLPPEVTNVIIILNMLPEIF